MTSLFSFTSSSNATCRGTSLFRSCNHVGGGPKGGIGASAAFGEDSSAGETLIPKRNFENSIKCNRVLDKLNGYQIHIMESSYQLHYFPTLLF